LGFPAGADRIGGLDWDEYGLGVVDGTMLVRELHGVNLHGILVQDGE